jgi:hypothetical protein
MKKITLFFFFALQLNCLNAPAQNNLNSLKVEVQESADDYDPVRLGSLNAAMKSCFLRFKKEEYLNVTQETNNMIFTLNTIARNKAMGAYQSVLAKSIFEGKSLVSAECERIINSDWRSFIETVGEAKYSE